MMIAVFRRSPAALPIGLIVVVSISSGPVLSQEKSARASDSARQILQQRCYSCHGRDGLRRGGFQSILDRDRLVAGGVVVPGKPQASPLYVQIAKNAMPKKGKLLTAAEKSVIRKWIAAGAPGFHGATRTQMLRSSLLKRMAADLQTVPARSRRFVRYLSLVESYNAGIADERLDVYRHGLTRLLNSLSWNHKIVPPTAIDREKTIYRIDIRDYTWSAALWERIAETYPYGLADTSPDAAGLSRETGTQLPFVRGDWFLSRASRPPLYHDLLELPKTAGDLERRLGVDVRRNLEQERRVARAGFDESGVSRNNRIIERHTISKDRGYWRSYDFASSTGRSHIKSHPLGPGRGTGEFQHDGGEIIFHLPNGLQAYLLVDAQDRRIDAAPVSIVSDPKASPPAIINGVSCMRCHVTGMIAKADEIRANADSFAGDTKAKVLALYAPKSEFDNLLKQDGQRFENAVKAAGAPAAKVDPVFLAAADYADAVTLNSVAAETGVTVELLKQAVSGTLSLAPLGRGQTVKREAFEASFGLLAARLKLGRYLKPSRAYVPLAVESSPAPPVRIGWKGRGNKVEVSLPEPFAQVCTGGAGRYLIFHFKKAGKLSVFDVSLAKFVHEIPLSSDDVHFAAGREKLMIVLTSQRLLQRVSLKTFEREKTIPLPGTRPVLKALMGCNSTGPLVLWSGAGVELWDVDAMKPAEIRGKRVGGRNQWGPTLSVSADGRAVTWAHSGLSPSSFSLMRIVDGKTTVQSGGRATSSSVRLNADASLIFSYGLDNAIYSGDWKAIPAARLKSASLLPTEDPRFFLALHRTNRGRNSSVSFCIASECRPVYTMDDLEPLTSSAWPSNQGHHLGEPRAHYLPDANLFVALPDGNRQIVLRKFDLFESLDKSPTPYLFVLSTPKRAASPEADYAYQLDVKSKAGGVTFKLNSGPEGMAISKDGRLTWRVPSDAENKTHRVVVSVRDRTGREVYHTFEIVVR